MMFNTSLPAAELVSNDSATEIRATPRRSNQMPLCICPPLFQESG